MRAILLSLIFILSSFNASAEVVSKSYWGDKAIGSHDTVAYHDLNVKDAHQAVKGKKSYIVKYSGAKWYFASQASADKFQQNPEKYKPFYNGHCANALSLGEGLVVTNGKIWDFFGDELHLFYAEAGRQRWLNGDWESYRKIADQAWSKLKNG
ncbi:MAG: YHS domain-containing (seleno)protein [Oceanospirillaceae bacterium]